MTNTIELTIKTLMQELDKHKIDYSLTEDTESIYTIEVYYQDIEEYTTDVIKFIIDPSTLLLLEVNNYNEEPSGYTFTISSFVSYLIS